MSTREVTSKHANLCWLLAAGQVQVSPEVTLCLSSTLTLTQCYLNFGNLPLSVASPTFYFEVSREM